MILIGKKAVKQFYYNIIIIIKILCTSNQSHVVQTICKKGQKIL